MVLEAERELLESTERQGSEGSEGSTYIQKQKQGAAMKCASKALRNSGTSGSCWRLGAFTLCQA